MRLEWHFLVLKKGFTYAGTLGFGLGLNWEGKGGPKPSITNRAAF